MLFASVFGGAISRALPPGVSYLNFLMAGIIVQTAAFGSTTTAVGVANDLQRGIIDRFRSLPMARSVVLAGRTLADMVRNVFVITIMVVVGFIVGFQVHTNVLAFLAGVGIMLLFGFAMSWVMALIGLTTGNAISRRDPLWSQPNASFSASASTRRLPSTTSCR